MKQLKWAFALTTMLFGGAVLLFFALAYPHHLHFQEQYQLFLYEQSYVCEVLSIPGGLADLTGRFLTQFFLYAWTGAWFIALVLVGIQLLTYRLLRTSQGQMLPYALSFIPALLCCCYLCDENALMSAPSALLIVLGAALLIRCIVAATLRQALALISIPIVYVLAGAFAIPYALLLIVTELRKEHSLRVIVWAVVSLIIALASPVLWHHLVHCSLSQLFTGPHYYRSPETFPHWAWAAVCIVPLLNLLPQLARQWTPRRAATLFLSCWSVLMLAGGITVNTMQSQARESVMAYDFMTRYAMWNSILQKAQLQAPKNQIGTVALNLALSQRGMLLDHMFEYPQNGIAGLLPNAENDYVSPLVTSEAFYRLGMINTAQRMVFEAQEAIPDFQKSARCYRRLAETNLINGAYEVARKYLLALQHTLYYRTWATETLALIDNDEAVNNHPEYGNLRKMRCHQDYFFGGTELHLIIARQMEANPSNRTAFEYLEASCMLAKDLDKVAEYYPLSAHLGYQAIPNAIQQALLLRWSQSHTAKEAIPNYFRQELVQGLNNFYAAMQAYNGNAASVQKSYGKTYWSYYYFR